MLPVAAAEQSGWMLGEQTSSMQEESSQQICQNPSQPSNAQSKQFSWMPVSNPVQTFRLQASLLAALTPQASAVQYETLEDRLQVLFRNGMFGTAVSALYEYAQTRKLRLEYVDIGRAGMDHAPRFTMVAVVGGKTFARCEASNKKKCKDGSSLLAWEQLINDEINQMKVKLKEERRDGNRIGMLVHIQYLQILLENPKALCGRRAMAGILLKTPRDRLPKVISLGTGNKTIKAESLTSDGKTVHDCHAEVLARRGLLRFLYNEIEKLNTDCGDTIFQQPRRKGSKLELKPGYTFHLYISTAPCGDAAVYTRASKAEEGDAKVAIYSNSQQGELRTKIEAGEGTLPIERPVQTWLSVKHGGTRLRTMSCSDKICKWNVLGLQGALLSYFMKPVYLSSVTIGTCYMFGHIARALFDRLQHPKFGTTLQRDLIEQNSIKPRIPIIQHSDFEATLIETERSRNVGVVWVTGDKKAEVIDSQIGQCEQWMGKRESSVSKHELFNLWLRLRTSQRPTPCCIPATYLTIKELEQEYQNLKLRLYKRLEDYNYGTWIGYPLETDLFEISNENSDVKF